MNSTYYLILYSLLSSKSNYEIFVTKVETRRWIRYLCIIPSAGCSGAGYTRTKEPKRIIVWRRVLTRILDGGDNEAEAVRAGAPGVGDVFQCHKVRAGINRAHGLLRVPAGQVRLEHKRNGDGRSRGCVVGWLGRYWTCRQRPSRW